MSIIVNTSPCFRRLKHIPLLQLSLDENKRAVASIFGVTGNITLVDNDLVKPHNHPSLKIPQHVFNLVLASATIS